MTLPPTTLPITRSRTVSLIETFGRDVRLTFRSLWRKPGFTIVVVLSLALGIGANTAIFSLVDAILLRPLPVPDSDGLISVDVAASRLSQFGSASYLDLKDFNSRSRAFESLEISQGMSAGMSTGQDEPQVIWGLLVSGSFFSTMQVRPALGRDFRPEEDEVPGKYPVAIISYSLWSRAFANDKDVIGKQVKLNNQSFSIIGVAPKSFTGADLFYRPDIYVPAVMTQGLTTDGNEMLTHRSFRGFNMMGRLKPGVTVAQAQVEMDGIMRDLERTYPDTNRDTVVYVRKEMDRRLVGGVALPSVLMGLVILVLLIACANVASLLMARATSRMREISTQLAVGASRGTLVRQLLTESAVLSFLGGTFGIFLGLACIRGFTAFLPYSAAPTNPDFHLDGRVLAFAISASTVAVFLCGLGPAFLTVKEAMAKITNNVRTGISASRVSGAVARRILIAGQIALSTVLLICGGLFLKAFSRAEKVNLGFNPDHVLLVVLDPSLRGYSNEKARVVQEQLVQRSINLPGVTSASVASSVPFLSGGSWDISIDGYTASGGERFVDTNTNQVGPEYFATMQIPLLRGREFTDHDNDGSPLVVIVNETLARRYIVGEGENLEKAIGHHIQLRDRGPISIVGVVKDSNTGRIGDPPQPVFYMSYAQMGRPGATLHVRTKGDPSAMTSPIRQQLRSLDPDIAPISILTFQTAVSSQGLFLPRIAAVLAGAFGIIALSLSVVGLYGVVSFMVGRRTQEIGMRIALGAQRGKILRMILANGVLLAAIGLGIGTVSAFALTPLMGGVLLDVNPRDPEIFFAIASVLVAATLGASWIPARRATRVDPMEALRYE
jgi:predicted permease